MNKKGVKMQEKNVQGKKKQGKESYKGIDPRKIEYRKRVQEEKTRKTQKEIKEPERQRL